MNSLYSDSQPIVKYKLFYLVWKNCYSNWSGNTFERWKLAVTILVAEPKSSFKISFMFGLEQWFSTFLGGDTHFENEKFATHLE